MDGDNEQQPVTENKSAQTIEQKIEEFRRSVQEEPGNLKWVHSEDRQLFELTPNHILATLWTQIASYESFNRVPNEQMRKKLGLDREKARQLAVEAVKVTAEIFSQVPMTDQDKESLGVQDLKGLVMKLWNVDSDPVTKKQGNTAKEALEDKDWKLEDQIKDIPL